MKETKEQKILWKILREMYMASTPSADFDEIIETAEKNEIGQKIVPYNKHEISTEKYDEIMETNLKNQRLTKLKQQKIKNTVANFAPKFILIFLLFFSFAGFSQMKPTAQTIEVYNYVNGVREISPIKIIEIEKEQIKIFEVDKYGIKNITPTQVIIETNVTSPIQQLPKIQRIEVSTLPTPSSPILVPIVDLPIMLNF